MAMDFETVAMEHGTVCTHALASAVIIKKCKAFQWDYQKCVYI